MGNGNMKQTEQDLLNQNLQNQQRQQRPQAQNIMNQTQPPMIQRQMIIVNGRPHQIQYIIQLKVIITVNMNIINYMVKIQMKKIN